MPEERYVKLVNGEEIEMSPVEIAARQAEENAEPDPIRLADALKISLYGSLEMYINLIDPFTELRIRQLQKSLEAIPAEMPELRFAQGVRPMIAAFELPDIPELQETKQGLLDAIDSIIANAE